MEPDFRRLLSLQPSVTFIEDIASVGRHELVKLHEIRFTGANMAPPSIRFSYGAHALSVRECPGARSFQKTSRS